MLDIVAETELFEASDYVEVDYHPVPHQLTALRTMTSDEARQRREGHFELLLRSRRLADTPDVHG